MSGNAAPNLVIALAMASVTYLLRAAPLLGTRAGRVPRLAAEYLRLVAPAILFALAVVNVAVVVRGGPAGPGTPAVHVGVEWVAVLACIAIVAARRSLFLGLAVAVLVTAAARAMGIG